MKKFYCKLVASLTLISLLTLSSPFYFFSTYSVFAAGPKASIESTLKTNYPIVLVPGLGAFDYLFPGIKDPLTGTSIGYFFHITETLKSMGATVYTVKIPTISSSSNRGEILIEEINKILIKENTSKVHLIGHSQGGLTARYVLYHAPQLLASITTIASPHQGSSVSDFLLLAQNAPTPIPQKIIFALVSFIGFSIETASGTNFPLETRDALYELSTTGSSEFNKLYPVGLPAAATSNNQGNNSNHAQSSINSNNDICSMEGVATSYQGVALYSWNAIRPYNKYTRLDILDYLLYWGSKVFSFMNSSESKENDGLVGKCSSYFGQIINEHPYLQNHAEEINISPRSILGLSPAPGRTDPLPLYITHVKRLQELESTLTK